MIVASVAVVIALALLSDERGLRNLSLEMDRAAAPSTGFGAVAPVSLDPIFCPNGDAPLGESVAARDSGLAADCAALLSAGPILSGDDGVDLGWSADVSITDWRGVVIGGNPLRVIALNLTAVGLSGRIPPELGDLSELRALHLYEGDLTGSIPPSLGRLGMLDILDLGDNRLTGTVPLELGNLSRLTSLDLSFNNIGGELPAELARLERLEWLVVAGTDLSGDISALLSELPNLNYLSVYDTQLSGCLPERLAEIDGLTGNITVCVD